MHILGLLDDNIQHSADKLLVDITRHFVKCFRSEKEQLTLKVNF